MACLPWRTAAGLANGFVHDQRCAADAVIIAADVIAVGVLQAFTPPSACAARHQRDQHQQPDDCPAYVTALSTFAIGRPEAFARVAIPTWRMPSRKEPSASTPIWLDLVGRRREGSFVPTER